MILRAEFSIEDAEEMCNFTAYYARKLSNIRENRKDFAGMRAHNGTAVRLFVSLDAVLLNETAVNATAMAALQRVVDVAEESELLIDLTGLAVMRPPAAPHWLTIASDAQVNSQAICDRNLPRRNS